jgi:alkylation response protein AidB-like acyl-CoA dehydrogenase
MSSDLVQAARDLMPLVRASAEEASRERRLPARVAAAMAASGLYRISVAHAFGGQEADPVTTIKAIEAISEADGSTGWNLMIGLEVAGIASGGVTDQAGAEVWLTDPDAIVSGALNPLGRATPVEGGWRLTGQWPFASGCHNAGWWWGGAIVMDGDKPATRPGGAPVAMQFLVPASDLEIIDTWHVAGMRGSGSHDVAVRDIFVPAHRTTDVYVTGMLRDGPLFRYPLISRLCYNKVGVATGLARAAIDSFVELAQDKTPFQSRQLLRERLQAQLAAAEAEVLLASGRSYVFETIETMWSAVNAGRVPTPDERVRQRLAASHAVQSAVRAVELVHSAAGSTANIEGTALERCFRDVHVVPQHPTVSPVFFETAGRMMLGLPVAPGSF